MICCRFRRAARALVVAAAGVIAACFTKPAPPLEGRDANVVGDGPGSDAIDARADSCALYSFAAPIDPCGGWGNLEAGSAIIANDRLLLTAPSAVSTSAGRCGSTSTTLRRATLDVDAVAPSTFASTQLVFFVSIENVRYGGVLSVGSGSGSGSGTMYVTCDTTIAAGSAWFPIQRYMRLISASATKLDFQLSTDGANWTTIGGCTVPASGAARVGLEVQRVGSGSAVTASYESLEICP